RGLHHPLPLDHAPALRALIGKLLRQSLEHGALRLLDLQEQRLAVAAKKQPNDADRADRADADRLESDVHHPIAVEKNRAVRSERFAVKREPASEVDLASPDHLRAEVEDRRRFVGDPGFAASDQMGKVVVPVETTVLSVSDQSRKATPQFR